MAAKWEKVALRNAGVSLIDCDHRTPPAANSGYPYVTIPQMKQGRLNLSDVRRISREHFVDWTRKAKPQHHDVILSRRCNPGETAYVPAGLECALGQNLVLLRTDGTKLFPPFLRWLVSGPDWWEQVGTFINVGAVFDSLKCADIPNFRMPLPPLRAQKAIAHILGTLDDKIELNGRMNATLEAMARVLFQSWFIDFDLVRAKLDGCAPAGLDPITAALFPAHFQDSPLGPIPQGWRIGVLDDLTDFVIGGDWGASGPSENENIACYCIRGADIPLLQEGGFGKMPTRFLKPSSVEKRELQNGNLVVEISGGSPTQSTGRPVLISDELLRHLGQPIVASNFCRIVKLKSPEYSKFTYLWLRRLYGAGEFLQFENGTTGIKNFAFTLFSEKYPLVVPDPRIAEAFDRTVSPLFVRINANSQQSRTLVTMRDTLLPKLLSGEIEISSSKEV